MERDKQFFRHVILHYFDLKKSVAEAHRLLQIVMANLLPQNQHAGNGFTDLKVAILM